MQKWHVTSQFDLLLHGILSGVGVGRVGYFKYANFENHFANLENEMTY